MCYYFPQTRGDLLCPPKAGSAQCSTPPPLGRGEIFPSFIRLPVLSRRGAICPQAVLEYVVFSRVHDMACLPGMAALCLSGYRSQQPGHT
jgi:hypothetical protein